MSEAADRLYSNPEIDTLTVPPPFTPERETPVPKPAPKKPTPPKSKKRSKLRWIVGGSLLTAGALGTLVALDIVEVPEAIASRVFSSRQADTTGYLIDTAAQNRFRITVRERGTIDSSKSVTLQSKVEGSTTIIWIVPEGTQVKEGDLLVELDASALVEQEKQQVISLTQANANLKKAEEGLEIQKRQNESDVAAAQLAYVLANLDLKKYTDGEYRQLESEQLGAVRVAEEELSRANAVYEYSQRMAQKGYSTANQLEADRISVMKADVALGAAQEKLRVLRNYEKERKIEELTALEIETKAAQERVERQGIAALAQFQADLEAARLTQTVEQEKLDRVRTQIANSKIYAPQAGEVVYATESSRRGDSSEVIAEGATVRERKALIKLPDLSKMKVDARIHESLISRVREGLPVNIRVDAVPGRVYQGKVVSISSVPVETSWMRPDLKEYSCVIEITSNGDEDLGLKPGLNADVEIIVQERSNVLQVPFQSVVTAGKSKFIYALGPKGAERREIVIGASNDTHVEILDGVQAGERIVLNPRTHFAEELANLDAELDMAAGTRSGPAASGAAPGEQSGDAAGGQAGSRPSGGSSGSPPAAT